MGNGRIGAMLYGDPMLEHIALNHDRLWRSYLTTAEMQTSRDIDEIRTLCREGKYKEAELTFRRTLPYHIRGCVYINPFVPFSDVYVRMMYPMGAPDGYTDASGVLSGENGAYTLERFAFYKEKNMPIASLQRSNRIIC